MDKNYWCLFDALGLGVSLVITDLATGYREIAVELDDGAWGDADGMPVGGLMAASAQSRIIKLAISFHLFRG